MDDDGTLGPTALDDFVAALAGVRDGGSST
jgi:hypothetical protein